MHMCVCVIILKQFTLWKPNWPLTVNAAKSIAVHIAQLRRAQLRLCPFSCLLVHCQFLCDCKVFYFSHHQGFYDFQVVVWYHAREIASALNVFWSFDQPLPCPSSVLAWVQLTTAIWTSHSDVSMLSDAALPSNCICSAGPQHCSRTFFLLALQTKQIMVHLSFVLSSIL